MLTRTLTLLLAERHFPHQKMALLGGPRQVGKTTLAQKLLKNRGTSGLYYNWDDFEQKKRILKDPYAFERDLPPTHRKRPLLVFDEIHKYPRWKNYLKGTYDKFHDHLDFLVTGSGRLNVYKKGADSLFGRYFFYNLLPLTLGEILRRPAGEAADLFKEFAAPSAHFAEATKHLLLFSGFPEPYLKADSSFLNRWEATRKDLVVRQDIRDLTGVREISLLEQLMHLLPDKIGSPLSINSLTTDIGASFKTVKNWIDILERVYYLFSIPPYAKRISRAIKKERKVYFWNWAELKDQGRHFENFIAGHLKKMTTLYNDFGLGHFDLHFCRDRLGHETDFLVTREGQPWILVEAKHQETEPHPALKKFMPALGLKESFQVISTPGIHFKKTLPEGIIHVISAEIFLAGLP